MQVWYFKFGKAQVEVWRVWWEIMKKVQNMLLPRTRSADQPCPRIMGSEDSWSWTAGHGCGWVQSAELWPRGRFGVDELRITDAGWGRPRDWTKMERGRRLRTSMVRGNKSERSSFHVDEPRTTAAGWSRPRSMPRPSHPFAFRVKPGFVGSIRFEF